MATRRMVWLPPSFTVFHGLQLPRSGMTIDHVVIGPTGVWVIDTRSWKGSLRLRGEMLWHRSRSIENETTAIRTQAQELGALLGSPARPVIDFVGTGLPHEIQVIDGVMVCTLDALIALISYTARVMTPEAVEQCTSRCSQLRADEPPAPVAEPESAPAVDATLSPSGEASITPTDHASGPPPIEPARGPIDPVIEAPRAVVSPSRPPRRDDRPPRVTIASRRREQQRRRRRNAVIKAVLALAVAAFAANSIREAVDSDEPVPASVTVPTATSVLTTPSIAVAPATASP